MRLAIVLTATLSTLSASAWADETTTEEPAPGEGWRIAGFTTLGISIAAMTFGVYGRLRVEELEDRARDEAIAEGHAGNACDATSAQATCEDGRHWETMTNVAVMGSTITLIAAGGMLYYGYTREQPRRITVTPVVGGSVFGAAAELRF